MNETFLLGNISCPRPQQCEHSPYLSQVFLHCLTVGSPRNIITEYSLHLPFAGLSGRELLIFPLGIKSSSSLHSQSHGFPSLTHNFYLEWPYLVHVLDRSFLLPHASISGPYQIGKRKRLL